MASQYKRVKLSKTGVVSATRIAGEDSGPAGASAAAAAQGAVENDLRDEEDEDDELQLFAATKRPVGRHDVLDDEDSDEGAPNPGRMRAPKELSAGASTSKRSKRRSRKTYSDGEVLSHLIIHCCSPWAFIDDCQAS